MYNEKTINDTLNLRSALNLKIKVLQEQVQECEDFIKDLMDKDGLEEIITDMYKVTYAEVVSNRFNKALFIKKYGEDAFNQVSKPSSSKPFHVYPIKK